MRNYALATTTESDENGMPKIRGAINGGVFQKTDDKLAQYPSVVIAVEDDIKERMMNVGKLGGKVLGEPMDITGIGLYVSFFDTEGNRVGMIQRARLNDSDPAIRQKNLQKKDSINYWQE